MVVHNFSYGLLNPGFAYLISCLGCFLGLQCTARARALEGGQRTRWLLLAAVSIGATGIWVMHFIAMLGFTIPGQTITYNVPVTILSMLIAVGVVGVGLLIVGFGAGAGPVAARRHDHRARHREHALHGHVGHAHAMGVAVSGMHYTGMAAMRVQAAPGGGMAAMGGGATGTAFLVPLILGITVLTFVVTAVVTLAPTEAEIRAHAALMERIARRSESAQRPSP